MKPAYFDLTVRDPGQARAFFEEVLGWRFEKFPMPYEYYRIQPAPRVNRETAASAASRTPRSVPASR